MGRPLKYDHQHYWTDEDTEALLRYQKGIRGKRETEACAKQSWAQRVHGGCRRLPRVIPEHLKEGGSCAP